MLEDHGRQIFELSQAIQDLKGVLELGAKLHGTNKSIIEIADQDIREDILSDWGYEDTSELEEFVPLSIDKLNELRDIISNESGTIGQMLKAIEELQSRFRDELKRVYFFQMTKKQALLYNNSEHFGSTVSDRFPKAIDDIEGAAKCLAFGLGTATVMHLMRVMEVGLKSLASSPLLGIEYAPSWDAYLKAIQKKIEKNHADKSPDWKTHEGFYSEICGDLVVVKQAWRNPSMHVDRKYDSEEAEDIFNAVRRFMGRLATGLPKPNK